MPKDQDLPESSAPSEYKPLLGLSDEPPERTRAACPRRGTVFDQPEPDPLIELTVIVPARE